MLGAGGPVEGVGGLPQAVAAQRGGGRVQQVRGGPGRIGRGGRAGPGQGPDLRGGLAGHLGCVLPDRLPVLSCCCPALKIPM